MVGTEKAFHKSAELVAKQTRHRRRTEKERMDEPYSYASGLWGETPRQIWQAIGASWAAPDKLRVKVTAHHPDATAQVMAEDALHGRQAERARQDQRHSLWVTVNGVDVDLSPNVHQGNTLPPRGDVAPLKAGPLAYLPEAMKLRYVTPGGKVGEVVGVRELPRAPEGVPREGKLAHAGQVAAHRGERGRSEVWGGARSATPPSGEGFEAIWKQEEVVALAEFAWQAAKGKKKERARAHLFHERRKLDDMRARRINAGLMHAARTYESFHGKTTRGKAQAERIAQEGGKPRARL